MNLQDKFSSEDRQRINDAVIAAESQTSAEIVPVVAAASGRYDRAEDTAGLWLSLIAFSITWTLFPAQAVEAGDWSGGHPVSQLLIFLFVILLGFVLGASLAMQFPELRKLFTPAKMMTAEVMKQARMSFFDQRIHHTTGSTGILIYLSLYEHRGVILADQQVLQKLGQEKLNEICTEMVQQVREKDETEALVQTISKLGELLKSELPRQEQNQNELENALILIETC